MIDWEFIRQQEGWSNRAYVPSDHSGVTIGMGFDFAYHNESSLNAMGIDERLIKILVPYVGLRGDDARAVCESEPLVMSEEDLNDLQWCFCREFVDALRGMWHRGSDTAWDDLTDAQQTVLMSVKWQYGTPWRRCPSFWGHATNGDWDEVVRELRDFRDDFPSRRNREADLLEG